MARPFRYAMSLMAMTAVAIGGCKQAAPPAPRTDMVVATAASVPLDPKDDAWKTVPELPAKLIVQDLVEPRTLQPTTGEVRVKAISDGSLLAFRLEWADASVNELLTPATFSDACAIQLPAKIEPTLPAPQMGEPGKPVEITFWTAAWQAMVNGRGDSLKDIYPNATIDHYPFEAAPLTKDPESQREMATRYAPAKSLGNLMAGPRDKPVQDLVAEGPGTLTPLPSSDSQGRGHRTADGWAVVIARRLPAGLDPDNASQIAFAIWDGSQDEVGARKMRTGWIKLLMSGKP